VIGVVSMPTVPEDQSLWANGVGRAAVFEAPDNRHALWRATCRWPAGRPRDYRRYWGHHRYGVYQAMVDPTEVLGGWSEFTVTPPSEYFLNCLRSVGEATALNGEPAYQADIVTQLITTIASRSYGPLLFRTVHVMAAAAMMDLRLDQLLVTDQPMTTRQARQLLMATTTPAPTLNIGNDLLEFIDPGSKSTAFKLSSRQIPLATACLEFMVEALGFACISEAFGVLASDHGGGRRKAVTKDLSNRLYHFLGEHLPQAAERNLARILAEYLEAEIGASSFAAEDIDDQLIIDFWVEKSLDETLSFKLFSTAARAWLTFRDCLIRSRGDGFDTRLSLTVDYEDEDFDRLSQLAIGNAADGDNDNATPDLAQLVGDDVTPTSWLADLQRPPCSEIKFLTKTELTQMSVPAMAGSAGHSLVLTCLRLAAFAPLQNKLVQASRGGRLDTAEIGREITAVGDSVYDDLLAEWRSLRTTSENIATTAYLRLWEANDTAIFDFLSQQGDDETRQEMATLAGNLQRQIADDDAAGDEDGDTVNLLAMRMFAAMDNLPPDSPIARTRQQMKRIAQSYRRQGLRSADAGTQTAPDRQTSGQTERHILSTNRLHALACGGDRLLRLAAMLARMSRPELSPGPRINDDLAIFGKQFTQLHETAA
jgi:hypothetical protein